jgi:hypothetical protein
MSRPPKIILSSKKAQEGGQAATLVAVIALLIIFYLLFIPPSFRDQILEGNDTTTTTGSGVTGNATILRASPGTLSKISSEEIAHNIPSFTLQSKTESKILGNAPSLSVKSSIFSYKQASTKFKIDDLENTDSVLLTFMDRDMKGALVIKVNGQEIFNGEISKQNPDPIKLSKDILTQGDNLIDLEPERAGWRFWRVNRHNIESLQLTGEVQDVSRQKSRNIFVVSATEKANAKKAMLRFIPECVTGKVGKLDVLINQHSVYYTVPDCGGRTIIEFATDILREGENTIVFDIEEGTYLIDLISITSELKEVLQPAYYFEITKDTITDVRNGKYNILLKLTFTESSDQKAGRLNMNGREINLFQTAGTFEKNVNDYIIEGNNAVKIIPETTLEILTLEIVKG